MFKVLKINDVDLAENSNYYLFFQKQCFGSSTYMRQGAEKRLECFFIERKTAAEFSAIENKTLVYYLFLFFPLQLSIKKKHLCTIIFLNLLSVYKGWRHIKGLPSNGQRTWTNGNSAYKNNTNLRVFKKKMLKKFYGRIGGPEQKISFLCEYVNFLWKTQWFEEWFLARLMIYKLCKNKFKIFTMDLNATARGHLAPAKQVTIKLGKKKKKNLTGSIGFDQGYTKLYLTFKYSLDKKGRKRLKHLRKKMYPR